MDKYSNEIAKLRSKQIIGTNKLRPMQLDLILQKKITIDGKKKSEKTALNFKHRTQYLHLENVKGGTTSNVEIPLDIDYWIRVNETLYYSYMDWIANVGSLIAVSCYFIQCMMALIGLNFIVSFTRQLKKLI